MHMFQLEQLAVLQTGSVAPTRTGPSAGCGGRSAGRSGSRSPKQRRSSAWYDDPAITRIRPTLANTALRAADCDMFCKKVFNAPPASALWKMSLAANHRISSDLDFGVRA